MSSLWNCVAMKLARVSMLSALRTSSWWNTTLKRPDSCSNLVASIPLFSSLAVNTTVAPPLASWRTVSRPMPLLAPVTTAYLWRLNHTTELINISSFSIIFYFILFLKFNDWCISLPCGWILHCIEFHNCNFWIASEVFGKKCWFVWLHSREWC